MDRYESLCAAIAMIDAACEILAACDHDQEYYDDAFTLSDFRNRLNEDRNAILSRVTGKSGVYSVDDLPRATEGGDYAAQKGGA